jgi:hypothetical protein
MSSVRGRNILHMGSIRGLVVYWVGACCTDPRSADCWPVHRAERRDRRRLEPLAPVQDVSTQYNQGVGGHRARSNAETRPIGQANACATSTCPQQSYE